MTRQLGSYLLRYWQVSDNVARVRVEHIQTGEATLVRSIEDAVAWISARAAEATGAARQDGERREQKAIDGEH